METRASLEQKLAQIMQLIRKRILAGGSSGPITQPPATATQSPNGTHATTVVDSTGATWTFGTALQTGALTTLKNGVLVTSLGGDIYEMWTNEVYLRGPNNAWYVYQSGAFAFFGNASPRESADKTRGITVITATGDTYTLGTAVSGGSTTLLNGVAWPVGAPGGAIEYYYLTGSLYIQNNVAQWFIKGATAWTATSNPTVVVTVGETADRTRATTITDYKGRVWSKGATGQVTRDGVEITGGNNGFRLVDYFYYRKLVWMFAYLTDPDRPNVFVWFDLTPTNGAWVAVSARGLNPMSEEFFNLPPYLRTPHPSMSPHGTRGSTVTDAWGSVWTVSGGLVLRDGVNMHLVSPPPSSPISGVNLTLMNYTVVAKDVAGNYAEWVETPLGIAEARWNSTIGTVDPLVIEAGTQNFGAVDEGLRGTVAEADIPTNPHVLVYQRASQSALTSEAGYIQSKHFGLHSFTKWADYGNMDVIRIASATCLGSTMLAEVRRVAPITEAWVEAPFMVEADFPSGMLELGMKLFGLCHEDESGLVWNIRGLVDRPYHCLPQHGRLHFYPYDFTGNPDEGWRVSDGPLIKTDAFVKFGTKNFLSMGLFGCTFTGSTPNADGRYIMKFNGRTILDVTGLRNRSALRDKFDMMLFQALHGGNGGSLSWQPYSDPMTVPAVAFHLQYGTMTLSDTYLGPIKQTAIAGPTWAAGQADYEWRKVPNARLSDIETSRWNDASIHAVEGPAGAMTNDWVGMGFDIRDCTIHLMRNGGHNGYFGNQEASIRCTDNDPRWVENVPPSIGSAVDTTNVRRQHDGSPTSCHTYDSTWAIPQLNKVIGFGNSSPGVTGGGYTPNLVSYDMLTKTYDPDGTLPDEPKGDAFRQDTMFFQNTDTGDVYGMGEFEVVMRRFNVTSKTWDIAANPPGSIGNGPAAWDTRRNRALLMNSGGGGLRFEYFYNGASTFTRCGVGDSPGMNGPGIGGVQNVSTGAALTFVRHSSDPLLDYFYFARSVGFGECYRIRAYDLYTEIVTTTGGSAIPPDLPVPGTGQKLYNKWHYGAPTGHIYQLAGYNDLWALKVPT